jgi:hypothetical protein
VPVDDHIARGDQPSGLEAMQHGVQGSGTQLVPVPAQLLDQRSSMYFPLAGMVHDVHLDGPPDEVANEIHLVSIPDIGGR